ncbi:hypothetical protein [Pseudonocardia humida]|uniref:DUF5709 domain-containing protein n=1 Tax=Pseudonocardia humida TaxID=2800819 RepID=A0ABT1ACR8_9PSEU|nr:hypothetical protein [Pseudonocardia humida]MCO1660409.1 hypothetical protein [Pseudonocardia humida]
MSSAERPEADVAEQSRDVVEDEQTIDRGVEVDPDAPLADVLEQRQDAGFPDEDEAPHAG